MLTIRGVLAAQADVSGFDLVEDEMAYFASGRSNECPGPAPE